MKDKLVEVFPRHEQGLVERLLSNIAIPEPGQGHIEGNEFHIRFRIKTAQKAFMGRYAATKRAQEQADPRYALKLVAKLSACLPLYEALMNAAKSEIERDNWKLDRDNIQQAMDFASGRDA